MYQGASAANAGNVVNNYSISIGFGMMAGMGTLFLLLTWYLDNVLPTEYGVPQPPLFCFTRRASPLALPLFASFL